MIAMHFISFLVLLILSLIAALIVHYAIGYRFMTGFDGFLWKWIVGWVGAWLGTPVLGNWFDGVKISTVYIIPALIGAFIGAFVAAAVWKADTKALVESHKTT
ncbi:MAG TPA: hypothetical protein VJV74_09285 [Terriglobia bacterium]|nr:hypothetical protein [Terriglobia bacterium]